MKKTIIGQITRPRDYENYLNFKSLLGKSSTQLKVHSSKIYYASNSVYYVKIQNVKFGKLIIVKGQIICKKHNNS